RRHRAGDPAPLARGAGRPHLLHRAWLRRRQHGGQRRGSGALDAAPRLHLAAPRHRRLPHAAQPPRVPPRPARGAHRAASGLPRARAAGRLVGLAGHRLAHRRRIRQVSRRGAARPRAARRARSERVVTWLRAALFNAAFYLWPLAIGVLALPLVLAPRRVVMVFGRAWSASTLWLAARIVGLSHEV